MSKEIEVESLKELIKIIKKEIKKNGDKCNLNHIDISNLMDLNNLFSSEFKKFNGNISKWDTSNILRMDFMFSNSIFNGDISNWDVSSVVRMDSMFSHSKFNQDIANWDTSSALRMDFMFLNSKFNQDISNWDVSKVHDVDDMFKNSSYKPLPKWY